VVTGERYHATYRTLGEIEIEIDNSDDHPPGELALFFVPRQDAAADVLVTRPPDWLATPGPGRHPVHRYGDEVTWSVVGEPAPV
jgi:hypothetical protein